LHRLAVKGADAIDGIGKVLNSLDKADDFLDSLLPEEDFEEDGDYEEEESDFEPEDEDYDDY
jgi:hypothetical protein